MSKSNIVFTVAFTKDRDEEFWKGSYHQRADTKVGALWITPMIVYFVYSKLDPRLPCLILTKHAVVDWAIDLSTEYLVVCTRPSLITDLVFDSNSTVSVQFENYSVQCVSFIHIDISTMNNVHGA